MRSLDDSLSDDHPATDVDIPQQAPGDTQDTQDMREAQEAQVASPVATPPPASPAGRGGVTPTPWTQRQMIVGAATTLVPWLVFSLGSAYFFGSSSTTAKPPSVAIDAISGVIVFIISALLEAVFLVAPVAVVYSRKLPRVPFRERMRWLGFRATPLVPALGVIAVGLVIGLGGSLIYSQLIAYFHLPIQTNSETLLQQGKSAPLTTLGVLAAAAIVAPICEEVFFRGFIFTGLLKRAPLWPSVLLSAVIFGVAHADLGSLVPLFIIGIALAWARWRTDSIWPGIVIHAINNTAAALVLLPLLLK